MRLHGGCIYWVRENQRMLANMAWYGAIMDAVLADIIALRCCNHCSWGDA